MDRKIKILLVWHAAVVRAYHKRIEKMAMNKDVSIHVITPPSWKEGSRLVKQEVEPIDIRSYKLHVGKSYLNFHGGTYFYNNNFLKQVIKDVNPDIIHIHEEPWSVCSFQIIKLRNKYASHSKIIFESWQNIYKKYPWPFSFFEQYSFRSSSGAIAGSKEILNVLKKKNYSKSCEIIPLGSDPHLYNPNIGDKKRDLGISNEFVIGYIGRVEEQKGIQTLVEAVRGLEHLNIKILIIGNGEYKEFLRKKVGDFNLNKTFLFIDAVPHDEIPVYMNTLDTLVLPSLTTNSWKEQFGRVLVEAMLCKKAVIGSDSGEIPNVIGSSGLIFKEGNSEDLRKNLLEYIENEDLYKEMAEKGYQKASKLYTWDMIAKKTNKLYKSIYNNN